MTTEELLEIAPLVRGALLRYVPAVTLAVGPAEPTGASSTAPAQAEADIVLDVTDETVTDPTAIISAVDAFVARHGMIPRRVHIAGGALFASGSGLAETVDRDADELFAAGSCTGRDEVVTGRVAVVTGGAQGFGEQIVRELVAAGARVFIADLNLAGATALASSINDEYGPLTRAVRVDIGDEESVVAMMRDVVAAAGGLDLFVANAGVLKAGSVKELPVSDFEFVTRVNYQGFFLCAKHAAKVMAAQNSTAPSNYYTDIVQINSKSGLAGSNRNGAYAGSKFGGLGLVQSFALELVCDRIKVNAICPGNFFEGPLWSDPDRGLFVQYLRAGKVPGATTVEDVRAHYEAQVPMGRGCRGEDVVRALLYIVEQVYETGQAVPVTGGQIMLS